MDEALEHFNDQVKGLNVLQIMHVTILLSELLESLLVVLAHVSECCALQEEIVVLLRLVVENDFVSLFLGSFV